MSHTKPVRELSDLVKGLSFKGVNVPELVKEMNDYIAERAKKPAQEMPPEEKPQIDPVQRKYVFIASNLSFLFECGANKTFSEPIVNGLQKKFKEVISASGYTYKPTTHDLYINIFRRYDTTILKDVLDTLRTVALDYATTPESDNRNSLRSNLSTLVSKAGLFYVQAKGDSETRQKIRDNVYDIFKENLGMNPKAQSIQTDFPELKQLFGDSYNSKRAEIYAKLTKEHAQKKLGISSKK